MLIAAIIAIPVTGFVCFWIGRLTAPSGNNIGGGSEI